MKASVGPEQRDVALKLPVTVSIEMTGHQWGRLLGILAIPDCDETALELTRCLRGVLPDYIQTIHRTRDVDIVLRAS